jgi:hypothetical protein
MLVLILFIYLYNNYAYRLKIYINAMMRNSKPFDDLRELRFGGK